MAALTPPRRRLSAQDRVITKEHKCSPNCKGCAAERAAYAYWIASWERNER